MLCLLKDRLRSPEAREETAKALERAWQTVKDDPPAARLERALVINGKALGEWNRLEDTNLSLDRDWERERVERILVGETESLLVMAEEQKGY